MITTYPLPVDGVAFSHFNLIAFDRNSALLLSAIPIRKATTDNVERYGSIGIDAVGAKVVEVLPPIASLFSSGVPAVRLLAANFVRPGRMSPNEK